MGKLCARKSARASAKIQLSARNECEINIGYVGQKLTSAKAGVTSAKANCRLMHCNIAASLDHLVGPCPGGSSRLSAFA